MSDSKFQPGPKSVVPEREVKIKPEILPTENPYHQEARLKLRSFLTKPYSIFEKRFLGWQGFFSNLHPKALNSSEIFHVIKDEFRLAHRSGSTYIIEWVKSLDEIDCESVSSFPESAQLCVQTKQGLNSFIDNPQSE